MLSPDIFAYVGYKVIFEHNRAVRAEKTEPPSSIHDYVGFADSSYTTVLLWLYVDAADNQDALQQASRLAYRLWGTMLREER